MKSWTDNKDGTVTLFYEDGEILVSKKDFDRAFGAMVNGSKADVQRDFGIKREVKA